MAAVVASHVGPIVAGSLAPAVGGTGEDMKRSLRVLSGVSLLVAMTSVLLGAKTVNAAVRLETSDVEFR